MQPTHFQARALFRAALLGATLAALAGCVTNPPRPAAAHRDDALSACRTLFQRADRAVTQAGVTDAGARQLADFPWLRVTRPLTSFRFELDSPARRRAWLARLAQADAAGRGVELRNLPPAARAELASAWRIAAAETALPASLEAGLAACRGRLNRALAVPTDRFDRLLDAAAPFDEYLDWQRLIGLYPLTRRVVLPRIASHQATRRSAIRQSPAADANPRRYAVATAAAGSPIGPASLERDALGIPRPSAAERRALFDAHAPLWVVETHTDADHPGALVAGESGVTVDPRQPTEYRRWSWTRFRGQVLVQLAYVLWFPARPPVDGFDIYAGHLDGLIWRVTLRPDGTPLAYESIHPCGCYYTIFPARGWRVAAPPGSEPVLAPARAPRARPEQRVAVRLTSASHYVAGVAGVPRDAAGHRTLAVRPLETLRSLPQPQGGRVSAFAPNGLIPSSRRPERFLLWPLGVRSAGAMRQWGTHAIAFVGKRHFDDPYLLDTLLEAE